MIDSLIILKELYESLEKVVINMSKMLGIKPLEANKYLKTLPKPLNMMDLFARICCLLKENGNLKVQLMGRECELPDIQKKTNEAVEVAQKFHDYIGNLGDVVNKARLYDVQPSYYPWFYHLELNPKQTSRKITTTSTKAKGT